MKEYSRNIDLVEACIAKLIIELITMTGGLLNGSVMTGNEQSVITADLLSDNLVLAEHQA